MTQQSVLAVFDARVERFAAELARCRSVFSEDAVHDLRVSIRRLLALLALLRRPGFDLRVRKLRGELKVLLASLGALRDVQVMRGEGYPPAWLALPGGRRLDEILQQREAGLLDEVRRAIAHFDEHPLLRRLAKRRRQLEEALASARWQTAMATSLDVAWFEVWQRHRQVRPGALAAIHRERITFKRLRYTVEIVAEALPGVVDGALLQGLRAYQTLLGDLQDAAVLHETVRRLAKGADRARLAQLLAYSREQLERRVAGYWQGRDRLARLQSVGRQVWRV